MSKKLLKTRTYSWKEFRDADRLDRIHIHLMHPEDFYLHDHEEVYLERMRTAFAILSVSLSQIEAVKKLQDQVPEVSRSTVYNLIRDTKAVFGRMLEINKKFDRYAVGEKLLELYKMNLHGTMNDADEYLVEPNYEEARKCLEAYAKIHNLDKDEVVEAGDIQVPDLIFTSNPSALPGVEDAETEEE